MSKHPRTSTLQKLVYDRIQANFAADNLYTFTKFDFDDLAPTQADRLNLAGDFYRRSAGLRKDTVQLYKVVGKKQVISKTPCNLYAPLGSLLPAIKKVNKSKFHKYKEAKPLTEEEEKILDARQRLEPEVTPAPVLNLHNILFNLGARK